jgi:hypothetical protein
MTLSGSDFHDSAQTGGQPNADAAAGTPPAAGVPNGAASIAAIKQSLRQAVPTDDSQLDDAHRLIAHALEERDAEAAQIAAALMDSDLALDAALWLPLSDALTTQPDAVYAFIRARLGLALESGSASEMDDRWQTRLRAAALSALAVAISDGDADTVINWLKLIAREPTAYGLSDLMHQALLAVRTRAISEPMLARGVLALAIKKDPEAAAMFLSDTALLDALPNNFGRALRDHAGDALALLQIHGAEVFMTALVRAARAAVPDLFTSASVEQSWTLAQSGGGHYLPDHAPADLLTEWVQAGANWLSDEALRMILSLALRDRRDDLFLNLAHRLVGQDRALRLLADALIGSQRGVADDLALIAQLIALDDVTPQDAVDLYILLLTAWDWNRSALPIMTQLARMAQTHPHISAPVEVWWRLLEIAADARDEQIERVALRRITADLDARDDDAALIDALLRLLPLCGWSASAKAVLMAWWRGFARAQPHARLQRLDKLLEGKKLDDLREVVVSIVGFRRMLGKRTLRQFSDDIDTALSVLQGLAEAFDPSARRPFTFDASTIREELDARCPDLTEAERKILINTLKELADTIANLGDNRSKASLMRRSDELDRQLASGEQDPHSAVDALKWMSGYLSGAHTDTASDET